MSNIPRPPRREPEWVGPDTTREDMFGVSERKLALRAVHEALLTRQAVELWIRQHETLRQHVEAVSMHLKAVDARVVVLEDWRRNGSVPPPTVPPMREKEASIHEYDPALASLRRGLKKAAVSKDNPLTEADLTRLVDREVDKVLTRIGEAKELGAYRRVRAFFLTGIGQAVSWGWKAAVFGALGWLAHHLLGH